MTYWQDQQGNYPSGNPCSLARSHAQAEVEKKPKGNERSNKVGYAETSRRRDACQIQH